MSGDTEALTGERDGDQPSRRMWHRKKWAVVAAMLVGSVAIVIVVGVIMAPHPASSGWLSKATPPFQDIQRAGQSLSKALAANDIAGVKTACRQLNGAGQRLGATLPSPDPALTSEVQAAVDEITTGSNSCLSLDLGSAVQADIDRFSSHLKQAKAHLDRAQQIAQGTPAG
ncbi:MAG: hypothetical protein QOG75_6278 [Mycobacterium sp.]|nr:hypothetical protein [Mycobacterium sp.]